MIDIRLCLLMTDYCRKELNIKDVTISIDTTSKDDWGSDSAISYLNDLDYVNGRAYYEIELLDSLNITEQLKAVAHEMVHVMQKERGDEFNYSLPYNKQPHELEAYKLQEELYNEFICGNYTN